MKRKRPAIRSFSGLLLAGALLLQVNFLPAQAPSVRQLADSGQAIPIAVMDFDGFGISQVEAIALSNRLRNELFRLGTFEVVDRGMMENILTEQDFQLTGCTSNECLVEVGQLLGAQQVVGGSISKVGNTYSVSARLVDVETGKLIGVSDFDLRGEIDDMLTRGMGEVALSLSSHRITEENAITPESRTQKQAQSIPLEADFLQMKSSTGLQDYSWQVVLGSFQDYGEHAVLAFSYLIKKPFVITMGYTSSGRREITFSMLEAQLCWERGSFGSLFFLGLGYGGYSHNHRKGSYSFFEGHGVIVSSYGIKLTKIIGPLPPLLFEIRAVVTPGPMTEDTYTLGLGMCL